MADGIDDTVDIRLIDTRQLVEEAKKIREAEKLAKDAESVKKKLAEGKSPIVAKEIEAEALPKGFEQKITDEKLIAGLGPLIEKKVEEVLDTKERKKPLTSSASPITTQHPEEALPKGFFGASAQTRIGAISGAKTVNAFKEAEKKTKELEKKIKQLEDEQTSFIKSFKQVGSTVAGLGGSLTSLSGLGGLVSRLSLAAGPVGIIIATVISTALFAVSEFMKQYERGGVYSTKLKVTQQALTVNDVEDQNAFRAGTKYITSDLRIVQHAPSESNTSNIKYEHIRYALDDLGR